MPPAITTEQLTTDVFGGFRRTERPRAFDGLSLEVEPGEVYARRTLSS